jgi:hypothetical protein
MTSTFEVYSPVETIGQAPDSTLSRHAVQTVMAEVLGVGVDDALLQDRLGRAASGNETVTIPGITTYISPGSTIAMTAEAAELQQDPRAVHLRRAASVLEEGRHGNHVSFNYVKSTTGTDTPEFAGQLQSGEPFVIVGPLQAGGADYDSRKYKQFWSPILVKDATEGPQQVVAYERTTVPHDQPATTAAQTTVIEHDYVVLPFASAA